MNKSDVIKLIFSEQGFEFTARSMGRAFAPTNIALCKYWGKRNRELNLPNTSSLSIALPGKGATACLRQHALTRDLVTLNGHPLADDSGFSQRLRTFLDLFRPQKQWFLDIDIQTNIPIAAGLASSACGFASLVLALNELWGWGLSKKQLSILARLGSGSASRSLWHGFVEWQAGERDDGMDSYATPLEVTWESLCVGILPLSQAEKPVSSRIAMQRTVETSTLYAAWPLKVQKDLPLIKQAVFTKQFTLLGETAESNALSMHATMLSSWPPICYFLPETISAMQQVWDLRKKGIEVYFTQDAGPNLKLLFLDQDQTSIQEYFPTLEGVRPFGGK